MNYTEFSFIGLIKLNIERPFFGNKPLLSQVRKTYEFGLVWRTSYIKRLLPSFSSLKSKEALINHDGEIKGKGNVFSFVFIEVYSPPLNMEPVYICISE